ncbi:hypothetical protein [Pseudobythopirellula maris]|uniref:hypothetical protein n=1 Tax=Pseudobythopirellula maris TaxID=2527991 RepID=UPI0011B62215|nr:hypothetical protein [Pseudobythopirellula maris]
MNSSPLQEPFLAELAACFKATQTRLSSRLDNAKHPEQNRVIEDELRGLYHGLLVILDGGSSLADHGLVSVIDESGKTFDRNLHEICFEYWQSTCG